MQEVEKLSGLAVDYANVKKSALALFKLIANATKHQLSMKSRLTGVTKPTGILTLKHCLMS